MRFTDYFALALRSLRRSRLRSGLTISAIVVGATGLTIMLTFVTSVKNYVVNQFVQTGQIRQIQVAQTANLTYSANGNAGGFNPGGTGPQLTPALELKIGALPHVTRVAATLQTGQQVVQYLAFGGHQLVLNGLSAYEADGVIEPTLVAGRDLGPRDTTNVVLLSQDYADALGFKGSYAKLVGQTVVLHTTQGYTGVGATLPNVLPPQNQCGNGGGGGGGGGFSKVCGPTSGLPAANLAAVVVGVVNGSYQGQQTVYVPLPWAIGILNQAQPQNVHYQFGGGCGPGTPGFGQPGQGQPGQGQPGPGQPSGGGGCGPVGGPQILGPSAGPGQVLGGWRTDTPGQYLSNQGNYQSFLVSVDNTNNIARVANAITHFGVSAATGLDALNKQKQGANIVALVLGALGLVALGIAALGVMNTMVMSVLERTREIGVMRALGARGSTIRRLFTFEAAALGFFGGLFGVLIGYGIVLVAKPIIAKTVNTGSGLPNFSVPLWLVILVIGGTTLIGIVSGLIPARRAARLDPVEALRYE